MFGLTWLKRKKVDKEKEDENLKISFETSKDGNAIMVTCAWPKPSSSQEGAQIVNTYANMLYLIISGKLIPTMQGAISNFNTDPIAIEMSKAINKVFNFLLQQNGLISENKPLVPPQEVFSVRGSTSD